MTRLKQLCHVYRLTTKWESDAHLMSSKFSVSFMMFGLIACCKLYRACLATCSYFSVCPMKAIICAAYQHIMRRRFLKHHHWCSCGRTGMSRSTCRQCLGMLLMYMQDMYSTLTFSHLILCLTTQQSCISSTKLSTGYALSGQVKCLFMSICNRTLSATICDMLIWA